ncbi:MAG: ribonuclease P protein component [Puniceicoccales bacterium]|jgi:ribonuclease P protein component|nr:ribonuclease P protein component [Puniceicoccales bacterium]
MYRLLKEQRLKKSSDFEKFRMRGVFCVRCEVFVLKATGSGGVFCHAGSPPRIGIITPKKIGNAVKRNRVRRVVREVFRLNPLIFRKSYDYLLIALPGISLKSNDEVAGQVINAAKKIKFPPNSFQFAAKEITQEMTPIP